MAAILHVDMDAFYASVEQRDDPRLRGKPVLVGGDPAGRGVVAAASYEARAFGVRSAMPAREAARRCPQAIWRHPDFEKYTAESRRIFAIFRSFTPLVEPLSLDEAFLDLAGTERLFGDAVAVARTIRERVRAETALPASVGVARNKFLAKLGSDLAKPDGIFVFEEGREREVLDPLPVERLYGVGHRTAAALHRLGIRTIGELTARGREDLVSRFGEHGAWMFDLARAVDDRPVVPERTEKSRGTERTFPKDVSDFRRLRRILLEFAEEVAYALRSRGLRARTVTLKVRYGDFTTITRSHTLSFATAVATRFHAVARELLDGVKRRPVRLLGLYAENLEDATGSSQLTLFPVETGSAPDARRLAAEEGADRVREKFGDSAVRPAALGVEEPQEGSFG
jgi:DNA polymerase-4